MRLAALAILILLPVRTVEASVVKWSFVSTPDFLNVDFGDLTTYADRTFNPPSGNSFNPSWQAAIDAFLDGVESERPEFLAVAGDLVMARWHEDALADGLFQRRFPSLADRNARTTAEIERQRIVHATDFYYSSWRRLLAGRGTGEGPLPAYVAVGDHELGDDPSWADRFGRLVVPIYRRQFARHFVDPLRRGRGLAPGSSLVGSPPPGSQHGGTAYAIRHRNLLLVTVDPFLRSGDGTVAVTIQGKQLDWLRALLSDAREDPSIRHVIVQGHVPVLWPVAARMSSRLHLEGAARSPFWQALRDAGVDLYLSGEVHAITVKQDLQVPGLLQISHGGIFGFERINSISYLVVTVDGDALALELKELGFSVSGGRFYQPGNPTTRLRDTITVDPAGFTTVGRLIIDKSTGLKRYRGATGAFATLAPADGNRDRKNRAPEARRSPRR